MTQTGSTPQSADGNWDRSIVSVRTRAQQLVLASYERSGVPLEAYAEEVIAYAESKPERNRRAAVRRRVDLLRDAWGPLLKAALTNWLTPQVLDAVIGKGRDHLDLSRNPAKNIWSELAVTYKDPPVRATPSKPEDGARYVEMLKGTSFDLYWQIVEVLLQACNEVLVWPDVIERGGEKKIKHRYATGDTFTIVALEEDPTEVECVIIVDEYKDLYGVDHAKYRLWTDRWHAEFERDAQGKLQRTDYVDPTLVPDDGDPARDFSAANPYSMLPMYLVRLRPWGDVLLDATSGEDLVDLTVRGGEERALYRYQQKVGGFKQLAATGHLDDPDTPQQLLDPGALLKIAGSDVGLTVIDWQTNLAERQACMMTDELAAAASRGINPERYKKTASYQTTFGARLSERGLAETRARATILLGLAEQQYKRSFCVVAKAHGMENPPDPEVELEVQYAPLAYPEDPGQQLQVEAQELALIMESQVTLMQRRHPEWTEEQARQAIIKRMSDIAWVNDQKVTRNVADDPTTESRSAEENGQMGGRPPGRDEQQPLPGSPPGQAPQGQ